MPGDVISQRALNRALLERQHLLRRRKASAAQEIEHLVAMQAQVPNSPYVGLWTRLEGFQPNELSDLISKRRAVRLGLLRNTIHLVTARDCLALRPPFQSLFERALKTSAFGRKSGGHRHERPDRAGNCPDAGKAAHVFGARAVAAAALAGPGRDLARLRDSVPRSHCPGAAARDLGQERPADLDDNRALAGRPLDPQPSIDKLILRYLAAFGPATVSDISAWSGLTALRDTVERLRPKLRVFQDERGRELFDMQDGPRPDPDTPALPRFLPEYDNLLLGHDHRTRIIDHAYRYVIFIGTLLVDGFVKGTWTIKRTREAATLTIEPLQRLTKADRTAVAEEGERLLTFAAGDLSRHDVRITAVASSPPQAPQLRR
jgi:Winged helix DNA-binding domain